ncbi:hypothetical protein [Escherichia coli]|uniref:hypothetical protein n=1 Tax=Escherichia coli TaxID=562 RepID=UPI000F539BFB|nr:hypothetical protein [Escherichia coli]EFA2319774.1 hypothetical protein [Escherichia coli]EFM3570531.1 hypothetical protein [Escherichia coli]EIG1920918.1 hypothetical protein [Escherichia coli]EJD2049049.1 hypothetical protein [Escherichia coli]ELJ1709853.1 hypothetical protein [Escherichia coli]
MLAVTSRGPSPLQRRVLIVLAALDEKRPGPVLTRDIERVLERSGEAPVYGPNLRASCRRMEASGWLRTLRAPNLQLAVELNGMTYQACRGDFVVRLDGSTCLQLWNREGRVVRREGDPLEVAQWLQACHDAGIKVRVQVNERVTP